MDAPKESLRAFADCVEQFVALVGRDVEIDNEMFSFRLLRVLSELYSSVLSINPNTGEVTDEVDFDNIYPVPIEHWKMVYARMEKRFGERRFYALQFDPIFPRDCSAPPVMGDLADDIADIYRDLRPGLEAWSEQTGRLGDLVFDWRRVSFETHWGVHLVHAVVALHFIVFNHGL